MQITASPIIQQSAYLITCLLLLLLQIMGKVDRDNDRHRKLTHKFVQVYLQQDGVLVLKLVAKNSTDLVVADIVAALWDNCKNMPIFGDSRSDDLNHADAT